MASGGYRVEAERWLAIAEKLLTARDFHGAKTFAIRARESDPRLFEFSDQIIAVVDTLLAGELRISSNSSYLDYYAILQVARLTQSMELIATQYRKLSLLLNPSLNRLSFADHAFKLVSEAWFVFSNPSKKAMYDREVELSQLVQLGQTSLSLHQQQFQPQPQHSSTVIENEVPNTMSFMPEFVRQPNLAAASSQSNTQPSFQPVVAEPVRPVTDRPPNPQWINRTPAEPNRTSAKQNDDNNNHNNDMTPAVASTAVMAAPTAAAQPNLGEAEVPSFWTSCPYCLYMYEYPVEYVECALKCQNCKRAFQATEVPAPPLNGKDGYFCCWGYFPLGFSGKRKRGFGSRSGGWSPFSGMFATPLQAEGRVHAGPGNVKKTTLPKRKVIIKDDDYINLSDPSEDDDSGDDDWGRTSGKKKSVRGRGASNKSVNKSQSERGKKGGQNADSGGRNVHGEEETRGKGQTSGVKRKGANDLGKLDLNVMFNNEGDETVTRVSVRHGPRHGAEEDNIEGISFFEGLDEFLSSLPILSAVGDDKAKAN